MAKDLYQILGISKSATEAEIKRAYRKLALQWHPDRNKSKEATEKFKEITHAYEILADSKKREAYDQFGDAAFTQGAGFGGQGPFGGAGQGGAGYGPFSYTYTTSGGQSPFEGFDFGGFSDPFEIFEQFFGGASNGRRSRQRHAYRLTIDFMEAVKGTEKTVEIDGKKEKIRIPAGVDNGSRIRFPEYDVVIDVQPDSRFKRDGYDLISETELSISQLILGDVISVATLDGPLKLKIPPGTQPGTLIRLRGKGVPHLRNIGKGDHYVRVKVVIPSKITNKQKELLKEFEEESKRKRNWF